MWQFIHLCFLSKSKKSWLWNTQVRSHELCTGISCSQGRYPHGDITMCIRQSGIYLASFSVMVSCFHTANLLHPTPVEYTIYFTHPIFSHLWDMSIPCTKTTSWNAAVLCHNHRFFLHIADTVWRNDKLYPINQFLCYLTTPLGGSRHEEGVDEVARRAQD